MPGMNTGLQTSNSTIVQAFQSRLKVQALVVILLLALLVLAWNALQAVRIRREARGRTWPELALSAEPVARRLLRVSFGLIWIFDGLLQAQSSMPLGMTTQVIEPSAVTSPSWVQHLVNFGGTIWSNHPITAPASAVWIQVGLGLWLLVAPRGYWSRFAGLSSVAWGLIVWIFGEAFGGVFAPGLTWAFGAPGGVVFYCFAGVLIALPERAWLRPRLGRAILGIMGAFFVGMAVLQAWPGRGFWQGQLHRSDVPGTLTQMIRSMAATPQPHLLTTLVADFGSFDAAHGWAVNLFLVVSLAVIGIGFLTGRPQLTRYAVIAGIVICLADWVFIEDFGFLGGVGTDPNSMIPMLLIFTAGYLAMTSAPAVVESPVPITSAGGAAPDFLERLASRPTYAFRALSGLCAIGITLVGAAPMALASMNPNADPIVSEATDGTPAPGDFPAFQFSLVNELGHAVSMRDLRGKVVVLTFLDPVCVSDCPTIAQELKSTDAMLGSAARQVEFVAVVANPLYRTQAYLTAFDDQEGLAQLSNWSFLTGSLPALQTLWNDYGVTVEYSTGGSMIAHSDLAYVIDATGHVRYSLDMDPGPGTQATRSSTSVVVLDDVQSVLQP
jgi:cytochrome oxidase Cu insertion factor (SCO1/SenC/PrrC family)